MNLLSKSLLIICLLFINNPVIFAQKNDGFYNIYDKKLKSKKPTLKKEWKFNDSAYIFLTKKHYDKSEYYIIKSEENNKEDSILSMWNTGLKGIINYRKDNLTQSLKNLNKAIAYFKKNEQNFLSYYALALFFQFKGRCLAEIGLNSSAINNYLKSNIYLKKIRYKPKIFENFKFIGRAYQKNSLAEADVAEDNYFTALSGFKELKQPEEIAWMYLILSDFNIEKKELEKATKYQDSCYFLAKTFKIKELIPISLNNYGEIYLQKNEIKKAKNNFLKAAKIYKQTGNSKNLQITYYNLANLYLKLKNNDYALQYTDSAINLAEKKQNDLNRIKFYILKKEILKKEKKDVAEIFDKYIKLSNKLKEEKQKNLIFAYQEFYKTEKLKQKNKHLTEKNLDKDKKITQLTVISLLSAIIFIISIILIYIIKKRKEERTNSKLQELQLQSIQSRLFPHLLFNTASAAGSVIYKEKRETAYDYLVKMSQLMRKALIDTKNLYKTLEDEINFTKNYLQIQKIRFKERFDYNINIDKNIDLNIKVPQMIIQTYVENAVKYGMEPLKKGGILNITLKKEKNMIIITIQDNGIGITESQKIKHKGTGSGVKIMNEIYKYHNKNHKSTIKYKLTDLYKEGKKGTKIEIQIILNN